MIYAEAIGGLFLIGAVVILAAHWLIDRGRERAGRRLFTDRATARRQAPGHGRHAGRPEPKRPPDMIPAPAHSPDWEGRPSLPTHHDAGPVRVLPACGIPGCGSYGHWTRDHTDFPGPVTLVPAVPVLPEYAVRALGGHFTADGAYDSLVGQLAPVSDDAWGAIVDSAFGREADRG